MIVFGATGDLTGRKLIPALHELALRHELPSAFSMVGVARTPFDDEEFRSFVRDAAAKYSTPTLDRDEVWRNVTEKFRYVCGEYDRDDTFARLAVVLDEVDRTEGTAGNRVHYLAIPPSGFATVVERLGRQRLNRAPDAHPDAFVRIVIEKPYGRDLASAQQLDTCVHAVFDESQVYRIDHYLGKETVQNILALRFANAIFEPIWNCHFVDSVQVTVAEHEGVGHRGSFYEEMGALRDIVQNHVMQVLALTLMEAPATPDANAIRDEKVKVLRAVESADPAGVVRGSYRKGWVAEHPVRGYREEPDVAPDSTTETFVAIVLFADNWRWGGVPIYIRTGKRLADDITEVAVQFRCAPHVPFGPDETRGLQPNSLVLEIQPEQGISLYFGAKVPGRRFDVRSVAMEFLYENAFPGEEAPHPYGRLLLDVLVGDATLFISSEEVMQSWRILAPVQATLASIAAPLADYPAGSWGPGEADLLLQRDGRQWRNP
jgi:glucose-6-phosphate 1-dehydrogenase